MLRSEELFDVWAPEDCPWSPWVKPVLFTAMDDGVPAMPIDPIPSAAWAPDPGRRMAIVIDLPGSMAVQQGVALAQRGYRPVPLFNGTDGPRPLIDQSATKAELHRGASVLRQLSISREAPPVFLLDSRRGPRVGNPAPGTLDNRWLCFPQDFPSHVFLMENGIESALLVQDTMAPPQADLAHVLLRWQKGGIGIYQDTTAPGGPVAIQVPTPPRFRWMLYRFLALIGFSRNAAGGFGAVVPEPSQGGGGFG